MLPHNSGRAKRAVPGAGRPPRKPRGHRDDEPYARQDRNVGPPAEHPSRTGGRRRRAPTGADFLACLYGLHALLRLHFVQQEENYFTLIPAPVKPRGPPRSTSTSTSTLASG